MSNDQPTPGQSPDDDPFRKRPQPPHEPPPGSPYGGDSPPPYNPNEFGGGGPYAGGPYGGGDPAGGGGPYGGGPYGGDGSDPLSGMPPLAPFGRRLLARIIDALIILIPLAIISLAVGGFHVSTSNGNSEWDNFNDQVNTGRQWLWSLISIIAYVGYDTLMISRSGQTLGKRWLGLRVGMLNDGTLPKTNASLLRAAVLWLPALLCCYCIWWLVIIVTILASRPYKQGWHDKAARTVVVVANT